VVTGVMRSADGSAVITVTDDGAGIPPEFVDRVFARFARADAARATPAPAVLSPAGSGGHPGPGAASEPVAAGTAPAEGTSGLGLSIVQSIVQAHGGTVEVTSRPGRTEFAVRLPAQGDAPSS
jgi:two-component system OmpR family sensor kinase